MRSRYFTECDLNLIYLDKSQHCKQHIDTQYELKIYNIIL